MIAVVTGGSGGLGTAVCKILSDGGYEVVDWSRSKGVDVSREAAVEEAADRLRSWDVLVNNAAVLITRPVTEMTVQEWDTVLESGLRGAFLCARAAFRRMQPGGRIVNISSQSGWWGAAKYPGMAAYVAAKSGLAGLTDALALEGRALGIRVNAVSPGGILTRMQALSTGPTDSLLLPEDVASVVAWLASPESAPLSGANLRIDPRMTGN